MDNKSLQNCPIPEFYNSVHHKENLPFGVKPYITPKTYLNNLAVFQPPDKEHQKLKIQNRRPNILPRSPTNRLQEPEKKPRLIPANEGVLKEKFNAMQSLIITAPACKFDKAKKSSSLIVRSLVENKAGPWSYNADQSFKQLKDQTAFHKLPQINKSEIRRRLFSQGVEAKSIQVPGVGQYNILSSPILKIHAKKTQWQVRSHSKKSKSNDHDSSIQKSKHKKLLTPSPTYYTPLPRSFSLFSTLKIKQKQILTHEKYNKNLQEKNEKLLKQGKNLNKVGPGKYLTLNDWKDNINDKKGQNFISRIKTQSVYR